MRKLTERPQTLGHQKLKLLLGKDTNVLPDPLPAGIFTTRLGRDLGRVDPVRQAIVILYDIPLDVQ